MKLISSVLIATYTCLLLTMCSNGYRILGVFVFPVPSLYFLGSALLKGLAEVGHDITIISPFSQKSLPENGTWREIVLNNISVTYESNNNFIKFNKLTIHEKWMKYIQLFKYITETALENSEVQNLIHSDEKFDVVIVPETMINSMKAFAAHFDAHLISFSNAGCHNFYFSDLNIPSLPSHFPELLLSHFYQGKLNYIDRIRNFYMWAVRTSLITFYDTYHQANLVKKHFPNVPDLKDIVLNTSLVLVNSHPSLSYQQPKLPMMIDIGGFHMKPPKKLPESLRTILDNAKNGVIYFSLGTNVKAEHLPKKQVKAFLKVFAERKELILWKCPENLFSEKPDNVISRNWFPQQDILAHPNLKLFITHSGFGSLIETIYHGVPVIAIPLVLDQAQNALFLDDNGLGINMDLEDLTEEILSYSIEEVISNHSYKSNAKERSRMFKDRVKNPMEEAIYWVEYVVRHNGAKHLRVPYVGMPWYQYYLLDIIGTFTIVVIISILLVKKFICLFFGVFKNNKKLKSL